MRSLLLCLVSVIAGVWAAPATAKELWERPWVEVRSPNFVFFSALSEKRTVDLARDLENFRAAVEIITNFQRLKERVPTTVYVLPYAIEELGFTNHLTGYFVPSMRANYSAVIAVPGVLDDDLKHEYVHFLVHNRDARAYPPWFDEGFAELLETLTVTDNVVEYGQPQGVRVAWLVYAPWIRFSVVIEARDVFGLRGDVRPMFYAQSWLLVHYLVNGRPDRKFALDNDVFLQLVESGAPPMEAFEQAFGLRVSRLGTLLQKYAAKLKYVRAVYPHGFPQVSIQANSATPDSMAAQLGKAFVLNRRPQDAKRAWDAAITLNPANCTALVGLGDLLKAAGNFDEATPYYEKAIALEPSNAYHELDYAEYFLDRARAANDPADIENDVAEARRHFARSYALDPSVPETLAMNGASYLFAGDSVTKALASLQAAHDLLPSEPHISMLLAQAYLKSGDHANAARILRRVIAWSPGNAEEAKTLLQASAADSATVEVEPAVGK